MKKIRKVRDALMVNTEIKVKVLIVILVTDAGFYLS